VPAQNFDISHVVRLCYLAEITKVVYHLGRNMPAAQWIERIVNRPREMDPSLDNFAQFCEALLRMDVEALSDIGLDVRGESNADSNKGFAQPGLDSFEGWYKFVRKYALAFARKCVVLLNVKYGVDFNSHVSPSPEQKELERLTEALKLPSFDEMLTALTPLGPQCGWPADATVTQRLVAGWVKHQVYWPHGSTEEPMLADAAAAAVRSGINPQLPPSALVSHPGIFELVGLPEKYGTLIELCTRRRCPTTGRDLSDPMVCLFCGEVFCGQGICCSREMPFPAGARRPKKVTVGGANQHIAKYVTPPFSTYHPPISNHFT
jgi:E3 ubiquitin-protein ligase UBR1